jgi:hypothetical protein
MCELNYPKLGGLFHNKGLTARRQEINISIFQYIKRLMGLAYFMLNTRLYVNTSPDQAGQEKMESKMVTCQDCAKTQVLIKDSHSGMWELVVGYGSISNSSWEYLEKTWLEIHHRDCFENSAVMPSAALEE